MSVRMVPKKAGWGNLVLFCVAEPSGHGRFAPCLSLVVSVLREQDLASGYAKVQPPSGGLAVYIYKKTQRFAVLSCSGTQD